MIFIRRLFCGHFTLGHSAVVLRQGRLRPRFCDKRQDFPGTTAVRTAIESRDGDLELDRSLVSPQPTRYPEQSSPVCLSIDCDERCDRI